MRFTISSTALSSRLVALSRVINSKNSLPILGDFLFEIVDGKEKYIKGVEDYLDKVQYAFDKGNPEENKQKKKWDKIFAINVTNKDLISKINKQLIQLKATTK